MPSTEAAAAAWPFHGLRRGAYSLVMIDPPWHFTTFSSKGGVRSAQGHYLTMTIDQIAALPVADLASPDCLFWVWMTGAGTPRQLDVIKGWGLRFVTSGVWIKTTPSGKPTFGMGYVLRNCHEPFALCSIGSPKIAARNVRSAILSPRREHSRKPDEAYTAARALIPDGFAADVFSREQRDGWDAWGNQTTLFNTESTRAPHSRSEGAAAAAGA